VNIIETFNRGSTPQYRPPPPTVISGAKLVHRWHCVARCQRHDLIASADHRAQPRARRPSPEPSLQTRFRFHQGIQDTDAFATAATPPNSVKNWRLRM
jgi:hypothetical protein